MKSYVLLALKYQGCVNAIEKEQVIWKVITEQGEVLRAQNIVLCISINEKINIPSWGEQLKSDLPNRVFHIFEDKLD